MDVVFLLLTLAAIVGFIGALINPTAFAKPFGREFSRGMLGSIYISFALIFFVLVGITAPPAKNTASHTQAAAKTSPSPYTVPKPSSKPKLTPTKNASIEPSPPPVLTVLTFSGVVTGTTNGSINVQHPVTATSFDSAHTPNWTTQCVLAPDKNSTAAWSATMTIKLNRIIWQIVISNGQNFGNPPTGMNEAVDQTLARFHPNALVVGVASQQPIEDSQFASDTNQYEYTTSGQNGDLGSVTISPRLTTGTIDVWESPFNSPGSGKLHIAGTWNCAK